MSTPVRPGNEQGELERLGSARRRTGRTGSDRGSATGPFDAEHPAAARLERVAGRVDFGSLRVAIPARAQLQVEKGAKDLLRAVHVLVPSGRVSLSALAAPRSNPLWRGLAGEIAESLGNDGAEVRTEWGEWGREVLAGSHDALSRFVGVDGPRWMLYGVATGPADGAAELAEVLREMIRGTVVDRGPDPLPVKTVLPLRLPEHLEDSVERARTVAAKRPKKRSNGASRPSTVGDSAPVGAVRTSAPVPTDTAPPVRQPMAPRRPMSAPPTTVPPAAGPPAAGPPTRRPGSGPPPGGLRQRPPWGPAGPAPSTPGAQPAAAALPPPPRAHHAPDHDRSAGRVGPARPAPTAAPNGLPPVPAHPPSAGGVPRSAAEATWSSANPVVSADQLAQQPAWALLGQAPAFWPHERYTPGGAGMSPADSLALPVVEPAVPTVSSGAQSREAGPDVEPPALGDPPPAEPWPGGSDDLLSGTDALHRVLTHDAAATQGWQARVDRRGRHRRQDQD